MPRKLFERLIFLFFLFFTFIFFKYFVNLF
ncbi:hypothetical protein O577_02807, partial [Staphylococcus aureus M0519]